ncbi:MAG: hypothetical protein Q8O67_17695 [Deltaproteobacteria bacterium]|nr:hypothetical protein [Deltaproteobacteria bacterium]
MRWAVVSGLGPNGMLATLALLRAGWRVTAVEQRERYVRAIHLSLRQSFFDDVAAVDAGLAAALRSIASPIEKLEHVGGPTTAPRSVTLGPNASVRERLLQPAVVHVPLDELERCFALHLEALARTHPLEIKRGVFDVDGAADGPLSVRVGADTLGTPDLIVVAEGGKSPTARRLARTPVRLSSPKFYISVHVDHALGPVSRRLDSDVVVGGQRVGVSSWATGHRDPAKGTWVVVEIPEALHAGRGSQTFDRPYFDDVAVRLLGLSSPPAVTPGGFSGTFRFEQQLLLAPTAGTNLVFFGDAAGMGHHALGTGLELGACDLRALRDVVDGGPLSAYADAVRASRVVLLAFGMREYDAGSASVPLDVLEADLIDRVRHLGSDEGATSGGTHGR